MAAIEQKNWIDKLNMLSSRFLMPVMAVLFIITNTVLNKWIGERAETLQNLIAIVVFFIVACNLLLKPKSNLPPWIQKNVLVIVYFAARMISLWQSGFDYSVIRSIFFEMFYLVCICTYTIQNNRAFYIKFFIWFELAMTFTSLAVYYIMPNFSGDMQDAIAQLTYLEKSGNALMFSNANTAGIMAGFSIVLAIICYGKKNLNKNFLIFYGIYNIIAMFMFGCRSADLAVAAVLAAMAVKKLLPKIKARNIAAFTLCLTIATLIPIYGMVEHYKEKELFSYEPFEEQIDDLSTGRYVIWKECILVQDGDFLFGKGSLRLEEQARKLLVSEADQDYYWRYVRASNLGPHNGYIGMISGTGIIGFALFAAILIQRMKRSKSLEKGNWHLMLVFIFVINCFESLLILNRFFACFYMFLILNADLGAQDSNNPKEVTP